MPSRGHPDRNEDLAWSAQNNMAHAVIDGMGGSRRLVEGREIGGEHAAAAIEEALAARLEGLPPDLPLASARELLAATVIEAGERIYSRLNAGGQVPPEQIPLGATAEDVMVAAVMTAAILCDGGRRAVIGQNGDTRAYLYSDGELLLLTEDQDAVQLDLEEGKLTPGQAAEVQRAMDTFSGLDIARLPSQARIYFVKRNMVFGQIGDSPDMSGPSFTTIQLRPGDMLLLCSDGVHANLTEAEIRDCMQSPDPAAALTDRGDARSTLRSLPDPNDPAAPYNYRAHQDDITALALRVDW